MALLPRVGASAAEIVVVPPAVDLDRFGAGVQIQVTARETGSAVDLTREAQLEIVGGSADVVSISDHRLLTAQADGQAVLAVRVRGVERQIPVRVTGVQTPPPVDFEHDVQPVLTRFSCNAGACHGKQRGQNGFQLSLLGFNSDFDFDALTKESRGRRVFTPAPAESLLLQKPCGDLPHGGGKRFLKESPAYRLLEQWIAQGAPRSVPQTPTVRSIAVEPSEVSLLRKAQQQLRVVATYSDGSTRDVTQWSSFQSNEAAVAEVDDQGLITAGSILGDAALMARFQGLIAICSVIVPYPQPAPLAAYEGLPEANPIDREVWKRLKKLGITPSKPAPESTVLRRLYLDVIGRGPTAEEARAYLADNSPQRREALINRLLEDPEYAEHWACKWNDLLRPNPYHVGIKATLNYDNWIRRAFRENRPYDQFVRELLTAQGSTFHNGAVTLYRDRRTPDEITTLVSQLFLGVRLECAKCHHHPFEVYGQDDFYSFAAYFAKLGRKGTGISAPISGSEEFVFVKDQGSVTHPLTGAAVPPRPIFGAAPPLDDQTDPREALAAWMTADENPYFSRAIANRVWADLMGRGLVEPVDDLRATNPPSNPDLLQVLADELKSHKYDLKHLIRLIASSHVYALSSLPSETNAADHRNFSRHYRQRLRAEVLYDTLLNVTGRGDDFEAMPPGSRAKELWTVRVTSMFLDAFSRQDPNQDPPCERNVEPTIVQALHLMNSNQLFNRITADDGRAVSLAKSDRSNADIIDELYLSIYGRFPAPDEARTALAEFPAEGGNRRTAVEDLMWSLVNTPEFVFED